MGICISKIFEQEPSQWGLSGDLYLWLDLKNHFSNTFLPCTETEFLEELFKATTSLTGFNMQGNDFTPIIEYNHGQGHSTGRISKEFWVDIATPMLIERLRKLNAEATKVSK